MKTAFSFSAGLSLALEGCLTGAQALAQEVLRVAHAYKPDTSVYVYWDEFARRVNARSEGKIELQVLWKVPARVLWPQFTEKRDKQLLAGVADAAARRVGPRYRLLKAMLLGRDVCVAFTI